LFNKGIRGNPFKNPLNPWL